MVDKYIGTYYNIIYKWMKLCVYVSNNNDLFVIVKIAKMTCSSKLIIDQCLGRFQCSAYYYYKNSQYTT